MITVSDLRGRVETDLDDFLLQRIIDAGQEEIARLVGPTTVTETHYAHGRSRVILGRKPASITSVTERRMVLDNPVMLAADDWRQLSPFILLRLPNGTNPAGAWGAEVVVTYSRDVDEALRDRVALDLAAMDAEFRPHESENFGDVKIGSGDYRERRTALLAQLAEPRRGVT